MQIERSAQQGMRVIDRLVYTLERFLGGGSCERFHVYGYFCCITGTSSLKFAVVHIPGIILYGVQKPKVV